MVQHPKWITKEDDSKTGMTAEDVIKHILQQPSSVKGLDSGLGNALTRIYARSAELLIERINQLPENYFRAFLDSAGVDLLPPKPANSELTFTLPIADDNNDDENNLQFVTVPERTQVATQQSETQPEVIFETIEEITVTPNRLDKCITFDPLNYSDQTAKANATTVGEAFTVFKGTKERERILFLGSRLFSYHETLTPTDGQSAETAEANGEVSDFERKHTVFDLCFELDIPCLFSLPPAFSELTPGEPTEALRQQFQKNKIELPKNARIEKSVTGWMIVDGKTQFSVRNENQTLKVYVQHDWELEWQFWDAEGKEPGWTTLDAVLFDMPIRFSKDLGDAVKTDEAAKTGEAVKTRKVVPFEDIRQKFKENGIELRHGAQVEAEEDGKRWSIIDIDRKYRIQKNSKVNEATLKEEDRLDVYDVLIEDGTHVFHNDGAVTFSNLPVLTKSKVGKEENYWLACKLTGGQDRSHLPAIKHVRIARYIKFEENDEIPIDAALAATQGGTLFTPLFTPQDKESPFLPFGPLPQRLDAFYLRSDQAFNLPKEQIPQITLKFNLDSVPDRLHTLDGNLYHDKVKKVPPKISWEYFSEDGWIEMARVEPKLEWEDTISDGWKLKQPIELDLKLPADITDTTSGFTDILTHPIQQIKLKLQPLPVSSQQTPQPQQKVEKDASKRKPMSTKVNDQEGYWIRARIVDGAYGVDGELRRWLFFVQGWTPQVTYAPVMQNLKLTAQPIQKREFFAVDHLFSRVDGTWGLLGDKTVSDKAGTTWHDTPILGKDLDEGKVSPIHPFSAREEGPALYLGFKRSFPARKWIRLLLDVEEELLDVEEEPLAETKQTTLTWQFWHETKKEWQALQPIDATQGLMQRGYLGFRAPEGHGKSTEFGQEACWIRAIELVDQSNQRPQAFVVSDPIENWWKQVNPSEKDITITVPSRNDSGSNKPAKVMLMKRSATLNQDSSAAPLAEVRIDVSPELFDIDANSKGNKFTLQYGSLLWRFMPKLDSPSDTLVQVTIDASPSKPFDSNADYIAKYTLRQAGKRTNAEQKQQNRSSEKVKRKLRGIRLNTVSAINKETVEREIIGLSNGDKDQSFSLVRKPVLDELSTGNKYQIFDSAQTSESYEIIIEVQEFDPPAKPQATNKRATVGTGEIEKSKPGEAKWHEWSRVNSFDQADKESRVFLLDPIEGKVYFGDGERGMIPLAGSQIRARYYCAHAGKGGNVKPNKITILRNPVGDVAKIEGVTNYEAARGGRDAEAVEEVMRRGPHFIKSQDRAVSADDLAWLARQAGVEIANAFTRQAVDKRGKALNGTTQVVVIPNRPDDQPKPTPKEVREVQHYLAQHIQANLPATKMLDVRSPSYVKVGARIWVIPTDPQKGEAVQKAVRDRLAIFLHPLKYDPAQTDPNPVGWTQGRNLFVSELYTQVESVKDVDYVKRIILQGSLLQSKLSLYPTTLKPDTTTTLPLSTVIAAGTQVSTLDERKKLILSESCSLGKLILSQPCNSGGTKESDVSSIYVNGFNVGDRVYLFTDPNNPPHEAHISAVQVVHDPSTNRFEGTFEIKLELEQEPQIGSSARLESTEPGSRLRLPIIGPIREEPQSVKEAALPALPENSARVEQSPKRFHYICTVESFVPGDFITLFVGRRRLDELWKIKTCALDEDRVYVPDGYLVCSGEHYVNIEKQKERT